MKSSLPLPTIQVNVCIIMLLKDFQESSQYDCENSISVSTFMCVALVLYGDYFTFIIINLMYYSEFSACLCHIAIFQHIFVIKRI